MKPNFYFERFIGFLAIAILMMGFFSCKPRLIPSTNVNATKENKRVVAFLEKYRAAVTKNSVDAIMELVAKDFSDNMGSEDPKLHMNYLRLKERLEKTLPRIKEVRLAMFVQRVAKLSKGVYEAVFYFNKNVLLDVPSSEKWISVKEVNRMVIRERDDKNSPYQFEIIQGI